MTNEELINYYTNLLIIQYAGQPNAQATIAAVARSSMIYELIRSVENAYNVDTALGPQLDVLGKYVGASREVTGSAFTRTYFGFTLYGTSPPYTGISGFMLYGDIPPDVQFRTYQESNQTIYSLTDEEFRTVIKLKIILNFTLSSLKDIDDNLNNYFSGKVIITDFFNMKISYIFEDSISKLASIAISEGLLIRPTGVLLITSFTPDINHIFGYKQYGQIAPTYTVGYKEYGVAKAGGWARYGS